MTIITARKIIALGLVFSLLALPAFAHSYKLGTIIIGHIWGRATAVAAQTASVYVPLLNKGTAADHLLSASTPIAENVAIHESYQDNGIAKMRALPTLELAPNTPVAMRPGGKHLMLLGLKKQLNQGDKFPLILRFAKAGTIEVEAMIAAAGAQSDGHH
jgi:periplasmic copper chaperone A